MKCAKNLDLMYSTRGMKNLVKGYVSLGGLQNCLLSAWNSVRQAEKAWLKDKTNTSLKAEFIQIRKLSDRNVQKEKRTHWIKEQENLIGLHKKPKEFWKKMNSLGNVKKNQKEIPMEIIINDGSITNDEHAVLERWANDFAGL